jgi:methylthioribose-1-phosphate isomerase
MRTIEWNYQTSQMQMIDQRLLPGEFKVAVFNDFQAVAQAISDMVVRGAPAIGAAAAFGMVLAAQQSAARDAAALHNDLKTAADHLKQARPTAVNLAWAIDRILSVSATITGSAEVVHQAVLDEAQRIADEDVEINKRMAEHGAALIEDGDTIIHHCNTGALATVDWGTALGVIRTAHEQGKHIHVLVDETRPRLQGSRLTAWELTQYGVPFDIISDNAAGYFLRSGQVQKVFVGSDRTAGNGDVANKIGTYMLALATFDNEVPFFPVVPTSTVDLSLASGDEIPIEERHQGEVLSLTFQGQPAFPENSSARNPAFDVTPHHLVTGIVTENGVVYPPFDINLAKAVNAKAE